MEICDKLPRPDNIANLTIPELPTDADKTIDGKVVKNDERMKNDQKCSRSIISAMSRSLDVILKFKDSVPELILVGDMLLDGLHLAVFFSPRFSSMESEKMDEAVCDLCYKMSLSSAEKSRFSLIPIPLWYLNQMLK